MQKIKIAEQEKKMLDNVNVLRVGFFSPSFQVPDTEMRVEDPVDRSGTLYNCLAFLNADALGELVLRDLEKGLPRTASGFDWNIAAVVPLKPKLAKAFKEQSGIVMRIFCDGDLRAGRLYSIVDSTSARPAYHPAIFVIGDEGTIRHRLMIGPEGFDGQAFRNRVAQIP